MSISFNDLKFRFGDIEAMRTLEVLEGLMVHADNLDRLKLQPEQRFVAAMERIVKFDFAA